jgi:pimeloyl-ACP methyl ester carboxylesterase
MPFLKHADVTLRYDRAGSGPAVLLVHGWTCNRSFWDRQVQALRDAHTVITVDLRGHGETSRPQKGYGIGAMAADLEQLVRTLGVPRIAVVGWSMGGMVALELARRLGPKASALGLVCTTAGGLVEPESEPAKAMQKEVADDFRTFARGFAARLFKEHEAAPLYAWALSQVQKTPGSVASACLASLIAFDVRPTLGALDVPTTVLHGRHDELIPYPHGEHLKKHIKGAELVTFEQSGHTPQLEEVDAFNDALGKLLARAR